MARKALNPKITSNMELGIGAIHDASFMSQPGEGSQYAYCIMLGSTDLFEGRATTHLLDWGSSKIHRKVKSTLAAEAASCSRAYDRAMYARAMIYEVEHGSSADPWEETCKKVPFCMGTDCRSLYDLCAKEGSMPDERRVALDIMDVREGMEEFGDNMRWVPTDHMLVDCMTKNMPPYAMLRYLQTGVYSFKYDDQIKDTKREESKRRAAERKANAEGKLLSKDASIKEVNLVLHDGMKWSEWYLSLANALPSSPNHVYISTFVAF